jgi:hypothetical protein
MIFIKQWVRNVSLYQRLSEDLSREKHNGQAYATVRDVFSLSANYNLK